MNQAHTLPTTARDGDLVQELILRALAEERTGLIFGAENGEGIRAQDTLYGRAADRIRLLEAPPPAQDPVPALGLPAGEVEGLRAYLERQIAWSRHAFGERSSAVGLTRHIEKECAEVRANPTDLVEWADIIILALDGFWRHGGTPESIMPTLLTKQAKNMAREWPVNENPDEPNEHDRSGDALAPPASAADGDGLRDLLERFRDFVIDRVSVWDISKGAGNHHNPIWAEIAEAIKPPTTPPPVPPARVAGPDLRTAAQALLDACVEDMGYGDETGDYPDPDDEPVGASASGPCAVQFGHLRRLRDALAPTPGETPGQDAVAAAIEALDRAAEALEACAGILASAGETAAEMEALVEAGLARTALASLRSTQADTGGEAAETLPDGVTAKTRYLARDDKEFSSVASAVDHNEDISRAERANALLAAGASVWDAAQAAARFPQHEAPEVLKRITADTPLIISHWQCRDEPGYKVRRFENNAYDIFVFGNAGSWSGSYGNTMDLRDLARYAEDTLRKHPGLAAPLPPAPTPLATDGEG